MAFSTGFQSKQCQQITQINMFKSVFMQPSTRLFIDKRLCVKIGCRRESWAYYINQTVESSPGLLSFILILLCDWSRKPAPSSQPIRCKTKDNPGLAIRFSRASSSFFDFTLSSHWPMIMLTFDRSLGLFWLWCFDPHCKRL